MAKLSSGGSKHQKVHKRTSQGGSKIKTSKLNKSQKIGFKKYRGQGR